VRIENFKEYIRCSDDIIFVFSKYPGVESDGSLDYICNVFSGKYPNKPFKYLLI